jgi:hypothetical protein
MPKKKHNPTERMHKRAVTIMASAFDKLGETLGQKSDGVRHGQEPQKTPRDRVPGVGVSSDLAIPRIPRLFPHES